MKTLVVYYSRTGHTEHLAQEIARRCHADLDRIRDPDGADRGGLWGYLRSAWQAACGATPAIRPTTRDPGGYDLVVIGTPVWNWHLAAPVRSYARRHAGRFRRVALFCTEAGSGDSTTDVSVIARRFGLVKTWKPEKSPYAAHGTASASSTRLSPARSAAP